MTVDPSRQQFVTIIEGQGRIGDRFCNVRRLGPCGGAGSFSLLFEADDEKDGNSKVALKFLHPFEPSAYRRQCFDRESELLQKLAGQKDIIQLMAPRSGFTCALQPHNFEIPFSYYAVELASSDLGDLLERGAIDAQTKLLYFRVMCRAVQRIHSLRIAHRDIKPPNFLLMPDGKIKLSDFGTARILDGNTPGILADYREFPPRRLGVCCTRNASVTPR